MDKLMLELGKIRINELLEEQNKDRAFIGLKKEERCSLKVEKLSKSSKSLPYAPSR